MSLTTCALILAAGAGRRFGAQKLLARLDGRPVLQHTLDLAADLGLRPVVVVLGSDAEAIAAACRFRDERLIHNAHARRGISSSLRLGLESLADTEAQRVIVLLGDQPRLDADQARAILVVATDATRPIVVPRYGGTAGNPVLLDRAAWHLAAGLRGDRGMSQLFESRPELVRYVDVPGANPDIDTPQDLQALNRGEAPTQSVRRVVVGRSRPSAARPRRT